MARDTGTVKWFSNEKGYGFIEREGDEDVFVHHSDIQGEGFKTLQAGESVEFEVLSSDRGPKAQRVMRLGQRDEDGASAPVETAAVSSRGGDRDSSRRSSDGAAEDEEVSGGGTPSRTLAEQLREKIGRRFFGG